MIHMKKKILLFAILVSSICVYSQSAEIWKIEKVNTDMFDDKTQLLIFIETSNDVFNYPTIDVIEMSSKEIIYTTHLTYYSHPGKDGEYLIIIPDNLIKSKNYDIRLSRSLAKLGEVLDFYLADKKTKRKIKRISK